MESRASIALLGIAINLVLADFGAAACRGFAEDATIAAHRKVSWADFQGAPLGPMFTARPGVLIPRTKIAVGIRVEPFEVELRWEGSGVWVARPVALCVRAVMYKARSRSRPGEQTARGLAHEQGHFDLTEVFARELRGRLERLERRAQTPLEASRAVRAEVERTYREIVARWREMHKRYDRETRHNTGRLAQQRWLERIEAMLEALPQPRGRFEGVPSASAASLTVLRMSSAPVGGPSMTRRMGPAPTPPPRPGPLPVCPLSCYTPRFSPQPASRAASGEPAPRAHSSVG